MRQFYKALLSLAMVALVLVSALTVYAGSPARQGTCGAMELLIPVGSRGTALGGNFTAGISGVEAIYWNPAGMAVTDNAAELMASHMRYIADININYVAVQAKLGKFGVVGMSMKSLDFGDIPVTTEYATDGTGEMFSPTFSTIGLSFSRAMTDRIFFGFTTKIVSEEIINTNAMGIAFDFGVQYVFREGIKLGVALKNLGTSMKFDGTDLERRVYLPGYVNDPIARSEDMRIVAQAFELPTTMDIGLSYTYKPMEGHAITAMGNFMNHHFGLDRMGGGIEYTFSTEKFRISLRGAATVAHDPDEGKFIIQDDGNIYGPSFGGGLFYQAGPNLNFSLDYAYQITEYFDNTQWFTLIVGF